MVKKLLYFFYIKILNMNYELYLYKLENKKLIQIHT